MHNTEQPVTPTRTHEAAEMDSMPASTAVWKQHICVRTLSWNSSLVPSESLIQDSRWGVIMAHCPAGPINVSHQMQRSRHAECFHSVWPKVWELGFSPRMMTLGLWINPAKQSTALHSPAVWTSNFTTKFLHKWPLAPFYGIYSCSPSIYKGRKKDFRNCISSKGCSKNSKLPARKEIPDMRETESLFHAVYNTYVSPLTAYKK